MHTFVTMVGGFFLFCAAFCFVGERVSEALHQRRMRMSEARAVRLHPGGEGVFDQDFVKKWEAEQEDSEEDDFQLFVKQAKDRDWIEAGFDWLHMNAAFQQRPSGDLPDWKEAA